jgi:hypothetical protein
LQKHSRSKLNRSCQAPGGASAAVCFVVGVVGIDQLDPAGQPTHFADQLIPAGGVSKWSRETSVWVNARRCPARHRLDRFDDAGVRVRDEPQGFPSLKCVGESPFKRWAGRRARRRYCRNGNFRDRWLRRSGATPTLGARRGRRRPFGWQEACRPRTAPGSHRGRGA